MAIIIREAKTNRELEKFIRFKYSLYKNNKYAAIPLFMDDRLNLRKNINPALKFCDAAYFMAYKDDKLVGRVAAIINPIANEKWGEKHARFGWIDFVDDYEVSEILFQAVENWAREKGMDAVKGPLGFTDLDHEGMLIEGFDKRGTLASIYNYPYYPEHVERQGYVKDNDWIEYFITFNGQRPEKYARVGELIKGKYNLKAVNIRSKREVVKRYGRKIFDLINLSYSDLYGYSYLNEEQIKFYIKLYLTFIRLDAISITVNKDDDVVALGISIPSLTEAMQKAKGRFIPFGWIYLLKALYGKNDTIDFYLMAVHPDYQNKGISAIMFADLLQMYAEKGFKYGESNPELDDNVRMQSQWKNLEHVQHKRRRAYIKHL